MSQSFSASLRVFPGCAGVCMQKASLVIDACAAEGCNVVLADCQVYLLSNMMVRFLIMMTDWNLTKFSQRNVIARNAKELAFMAEIQSSISRERK
jgi:hypothetical protein